MVRNSYASHKTGKITQSISCIRNINAHLPITVLSLTSYSTTDEISRSSMLVFWRVCLPWGFVINLSTCTLIPCSRGFSCGLLFPFIYRKHSPSQMHAARENPAPFSFCLSWLLFIFSFFPPFFPSECFLVPFIDHFFLMASGELQSLLSFCGQNRYAPAGTHTAVVYMFLALQISGARVVTFIVLSACIFRGGAKRHPI
jgi:hypothetical protein